MRTEWRISRFAAFAVALGLVALGAAVFVPVSSAARVVATELAATSARVTVQGTDGADVIVVTQLNDGSVAVWVNGVETIVPPDSANDVVVSALAGDDQVYADATLMQAVAVLAGAGADHVVTGFGADYVDGGPGRDVLDAGAGDDVIYGGHGADQLLGGDGGDYLDGGDGDDVASGGAGGDVLMGGLGADTIDGGDGDDLMAGGPGVDAYAGGAGLQRTFAQRSDRRPLVDAGVVTWVSLSGRNAAGEAIGSSLAFAATGGFAQRFASDVEALRSLPVGRRLLRALDAPGLRVRVVRSGSGNRTTIGDASAAFLRKTGRCGPGSASIVAYDPIGTLIADGSEAWMRRPPVVGLYHELVHALGAATGSLQPGRTDVGVPKLELQAIGLPFDGILWDHDGSSSTPRQAGNQRVFTENGCRGFLGLQPRDRY